MNKCELTKHDALKMLIKKPVIFGHTVGFKLLTKLHNKWIKQMVYDKGDMTLQAHRG